MKKELLCPFCRKVAASSDQKIWPFCSERCKTADLGKWASEGYRIAGGAPKDPEEENSEDED